MYYFNVFVNEVCRCKELSEHTKYTLIQNNERKVSNVFVLNLLKNINL